MQNAPKHCSPVLSILVRRESIFLSVCNSKVIQIGLKAVLGGEAGVHEEAFDLIPFFEVSVVEQLQIVLNN